MVTMCFAVLLHHYIMAKVPLRRRDIETSLLKPLKVCKMRMRDESVPNPTPTKVPGEFLGFTEHGRWSRCASCTQWLRSCLGRSVGTFTKDLAAGGEAALAEYVAVLTRFEQLWEATPGAYLTNVKGRIPLPSFVLSD